MKQLTSTGKTVEEAVDLALHDLKTTKDRVEIMIVDKGKKGLFGIFGSKPAIVKVKKLHDPKEEAETFLRSVTEKMGVYPFIDIHEDGNELTFQLSGEKIAILIGKRGQTLNSLQYLTHLVANRNSDQFITIIVDAENYRQRRKETLENLAARLAEKAIRSRKPVNIEPMPNYERKIIHNALYKNRAVKTFSEGNEPNRYIVIVPNKK